MFNRHLIEALDPGLEIDVLRWSTGDWGAGSVGTPLPRAAPDTVVVDSLLVAEPAGLRALRAAWPHARLVLLVHYLALLESSTVNLETTRNERALLPLFDGFITTSEYSAGRLTANGVPHARIRTVTPGLGSVFRVPRSGLRSHPRVARLLTVASLTPGKGLEVLAETLAGKVRGDWCWDVIGDPRLDPLFSRRLGHTIDRLRIGPRTRILGPVTPAALVKHYDRATVFVLPSRFESYSMATMEAIARGAPVVAFRVGGLPECLGAGAGAALCAPGDADEFAARVQALIDDPRRRACLGSDLRRRARQFPSWADVGQRFVMSLGTFGHGSFEACGHVG